MRQLSEIGLLVDSQLKLETHRRNDWVNPPRPLSPSYLRLHQIADELIRLYRQQFTLWVLGKMDELSSTDLFKYERRKVRIEQLRQELQKMTSRVLPGTIPV